MSVTQIITGSAGTGIFACLIFYFYIELACIRKRFYKENVSIHFLDRAQQSKAPFIICVLELRISPSILS
jgi:hypothetical protein